MASGVPIDVASRPAARLGKAIATVFVLAGFFLLLPRVMVVEQARSWPVAKATILSRTISSEFDYTAVGKYRNYNTYEERLRARYRYTVNGVAYESYHLSPHADYIPMSGGVRNWLQVGDVVEAHVNPEDPSEAVIDVRRSVVDLLVFALWLLGTAWLVNGWRTARFRAREA